jgi:hypothetical protein
MLTGCVLAAVLAVAALPADAARPTRHPSAQAAAPAKAHSGVAFGGITQSDWPIVVALNEAGTRVDQIVIGLDMTCTSGDSFGTNDGFKGLKISKKARFSTVFGPRRIDAGGVPADVESRVVGRFTKGRASIRGVWTQKITLYDPTGTTVIDTCQSGLVNWAAIQ